MAVADNSGAGQWRRIIATVKPIRKVKVEKDFQLSPSRLREGLGVGSLETQESPPPPPPASGRGERPHSFTQKGRGLSDKSTPSRTPSLLIGTDAIDKVWERDLRSGKLSIDMVIDLHDHHLAGAHSALASALDRAVAQGARMLLIVAGKARGPDEAPRGAIRRELTTWLIHSPHANRILAVRNAHPRHGGAGAVYILLRKQTPVR